jgi:hypothetical protein
LSAWYPLYTERVTSVIPPRQFLFNQNVTMSAASIGGVCATFPGTFCVLNSDHANLMVAPFTVSAWVYTNTVSGGNRQVWAITGLSDFKGWFFYSANGVPSFQANDGATGIATATNNLTTFNWYHMVGIEYGTASRACFLNGASKGTNTTTIVPGMVSPSNENIGTYRSGNGDFWSGQIADVRLYNRALSDAEVWALYDPRSRWDLYWQPNTRAYSFMSIAASAAGYLLVKN